MVDLIIMYSLGWKSKATVSTMNEIRYNGPIALLYYQGLKRVRGKQRKHKRNDDCIWFANCMFIYAVECILIQYQ